MANEAHLQRTEKLRAAVLHVRVLSCLFLLNIANVSMPTKFEYVRVIFLEIHFETCKLNIDFGCCC